MTTEDGHRRRRRRRASPDDSAQPGDRSTPLPGPGAAPGAAAPHPEPPLDRQSETRPRRPRQTQSSRDSGERGLRDLVGAGRSQLGVSGALRGRDVNRPTDDDLEEAEANLTIVRRHWTPPPDNATKTP
jgi:hypothetical protein